ncbi:hypothetical protein PTKIN_Ptkin18bG0028100 [Pterospermum kingtungense]
MRMQWMHSFIFLLLLIFKIVVAAPPLAKNNCKDRCGNVSIPYPFGIGAKCSLNSWFEIYCNDSSSPPTSLLTSIQMEVLEIPFYGRQSYSYGQYVRVKSPIISQNCTGTRKTSKPVDFTGSPFVYSDDRNIFVAVGCNNRAFMAGIEPAIVGCESDCKGQRISAPNGTCNGEGCCQTVIPSGLQLFNATLERKSSEAESDQSEDCKVTFLVDQVGLNISNMTGPSTVQSLEYVPAILRWEIALESFELPERETKEYNCTLGSELNSTIITCNCLYGYEGNPYLPNGCQDIDECMELNFTRCDKGTCVNTAGSYKCEGEQLRNFGIILGLSLGFGVLLLFFGGWWLYKFLKERRKTKLRKMYFKRNGGLLLQQQMFSSEGGFQQTMLFRSKELDKATDHFNKNRILGQGGQGTVYKGMLVDGRIVAVKKSKALEADKVEDFINEVFILSQINHRNVVKILGCCLETEVPLLVYEFIPNGTLFHYLHNQAEEFQLSWKMRLKIAMEAAEAISYLHSSASLPIYHRDIKSANILLDEKYRAKVSDFGISRSLAIDQTHLTTNVQGTFGYLDPEYFQSSQFTEKSDVYSFGVVLVELITGEKPVSIVRAEEGRSLATHFIFLMQENRLFDIVDTRIMQDSVHEEIDATAKLAYRCLRLSGKNRPTMKEVAAELERISLLQKGSNVQPTHEELEYGITDMNYTWGAASISTSSASDTGAGSSLELEPFIY